MESAKLQLSMSWLDADGNPQTPGPRTCCCPYSTVLTGSVAVPAGAAANTEYDLPLPGIVDATLVFIENETDAELTGAWGGNWAPDLPANGVILLANPLARTANMIAPGSTLRFVTKAPVVKGGNIVYRVFGS